MKLLTASRIIRELMDFVDPDDRRRHAGQRFAEVSRQAEPRVERADEQLAKYKRLRKAVLPTVGAILLLTVVLPPVDVPLQAIVCWVSFPGFSRTFYVAFGLAAVLFIAAIILVYFGWLRHFGFTQVGLIVLFSLIGIAGSYGVAWFGIRINTFANSRSAFASLKGKPFPTYAIPLKAGMSIGMLLISTELVIMLAILGGRLTPFQWISRGLMTAAREEFRQALYYLALVWSNGLFLYVVAAWLGKKLYRRGSNRVATGGSLRKRYGGHWLDAIAGAGTNESPGTLGLQVALVTAAIYEAAKTRQVVQL